MARTYRLPFHPSITSDDPLSIMDHNDEGPVVQADILQKLFHAAETALEQSPDGASTTLVELLEDIAYTIHGDGNLKTGSLKTTLHSESSIGIFKLALQNALTSAINLNAAIPSQELSCLSIDQPEAHIDARAARAIVAHAVLGTLNSCAGTTWGPPGFTSWYADTPRHPQAVDGYLRMLFDYLAYPGDDLTCFAARLSCGTSMPNPDQCISVPKVSISIVDQIREPSDSMTEDIPFVLVAANKEPGPGPTGTQEERLQAASPWLILCSLLCPVLPDDAAVVTSALPVLGSWTGHNRTAGLQHTYTPDKRPERHYILADALPLDEAEASADGLLPDLRPGNVEREVKKLYAAFAGAMSVSKAEKQSRCVVEAPPWGCGAFGGNFAVKVKCMMIAAGLSGVTLELSVTRERAEDVAMIENLLKKGVTVAELWSSLVDHLD